MISIIVPVYNVEKYLKSCLDSIVNQTYRDLEIILIDDGSTDSSGAICDEYAKNDFRIKVVHKENGGQSSARNTGLEIATGEFVGFVDSDDSIYLDMFSCLHSAIEDVDVSICGHNIVCGDKIESICDNKEDKILSYNELWEEVFGKLNNAVWNKLYRKEILRDIRFNTNFSHGEDLLFNILYLERAKSGKIIDKALYNYYKRGDSITTGKFNSRKLLEADSKDEALKLVKQIYPPMTQTAKKYCFRARMNLIRNIYKAKVKNQYQAELKNYKEYVFQNYSKVKAQLRSKERFEFFLLKYFKCIYFLVTN